MRNLIDIAEMFDRGLADNYEQQLNSHINTYIGRGGSMPEY